MAYKYEKKNDLKAFGPTVRPPRIDPVNPPAPQATYGSAIDTSAPIRGAFAQSLLAGNLPYRNPGVGATGSSMSAFGRALMDDTRRGLAMDMNKFNVAQQTQAEKSRAEDILSQRQSVHDRYRMNASLGTFFLDTAQRLSQGMKDLKEKYAREKKEASASFWSSVL